MKLTPPVSRVVLVVSFTLLSLSATRASQPTAVVVNEPIPSGSAMTTNNEALIAIMDSGNGSGPEAHVGMGGIERSGLSTITGEGTLLDIGGGQATWHIESGFAAITTDLTNFPTWTTDRIEAGGEALTSGSTTSTSPIEGDYYSLVETRQHNGQWRDRVFCYKGTLIIHGVFGSETMTLQPGQYAEAMKKGSNVSIDGPYSFITNPPADVTEFLNQVTPKLNRLDMPLPSVNP